MQRHFRSLAPGTSWNNRAAETASQPLSPGHQPWSLWPSLSHPIHLWPLDACPVQVREHTWHLEAELEKHMAAASAECQNYAQEVAGVSPIPSSPAGRAG